MKFILFFVFAFFLVGVLTIPESSAQDVIPLWIKNNAGWWADDKINDFTFAQGIGFLIKNKINNDHFPFYLHRLYGLHWI